MTQIPIKDIETGVIDWQELSRLGTYLDTKQACLILGIKKLNTLYEYIKSGKLKAYKLGGSNSKRHWRIKLADLEAFVTGQEPESKHTESTDKG